MSEKRALAAHECGKALVGALMPNFEQLAKISLLPDKSEELSLTYFIPDEAREESQMITMAYLIKRMTVLFAGQEAEKILYGDQAVSLR